MFDAADFALFGAALPPIAKEFGLGPAEAGLLATVGLVGAFCGALFWGTISDYIGRRTAFSATVGIFAVFTGLVAASWNVLSLGVFRFFSNFGLGGEVPVTATLSSEFSPGRIRGRMAGSILAAFPLGLAIAAILSLTIIPTLGWRALFIVGVVPAALLVFVRWYMPESVRYLVSKQRYGEAEQVVNDIESQALGHIRTPQEIAALPKPPSEEMETPRVTVFELLTAGRWRRTSLLWIVSFGFLWASNGILFMLPTILLARGIPLTQAITFMLVQAISAFFGYTACGFLIDRFGRRPVLFLYFFIGAFFHLWFALASGIWLYFAAAAVGWVNPGVLRVDGHLCVRASSHALAGDRGRMVLRNWTYWLFPGACRDRLHACIRPRRLRALHLRGGVSRRRHRALVCRRRDERPRARGNQPDKSRNRLTAW